MFHGYKRARTGKGDADPNFQRYFLVGRPLRPSTQRFEGLQYLCRWSAGISCTEFHPGVEGGHGNRLITAKQ